jgi:hypothetical protein
VCLDLGHPRDVMAMRSVQVRPFQVQLAEPFQYVPGASKVLLVVNNRTTAAEVEEWKALCVRALNAADERCVSVWNLSLYGGVSLKHKVSVAGEADKQPLAKLFSGDDCVVVILNNQSSVTGVRAGDDDERFPMQRVQHQELLHACRDFGCRIYVYGARAGLDLRARLQIPVDASVVREFADEQSLLDGAAAALRPTAPLFETLAGAAVEEHAVAAVADSLPRPAWMRSELRGVLLKVRKSGCGTRRQLFVLRHGELLCYAGEDSRAPRKTYPLAECTLGDDGGGTRDVLCLQTPGRLVKLKDVSRARSHISPGPSLHEWRRAVEGGILSARTRAERGRNGGDEREGGRAPGDCRVAGANTFCATQVMRRRTASGLAADAALKARAEALADQLHMSYPEASWCVVYDAPRGGPVTGGGLLHKRSIGELQLHMGLLHDGGNVVTNWYEEGEGDGSFVHCDVSAERNAYGLIKALSLVAKLRLLRESGRDGSLGRGEQEAGRASLHLVVDALVSDAADENALFRYGSVATVGKLATAVLAKKRASELDMWAQRMRVLTAIVDETGACQVEKGTVKYAELFRLLATLRLLALRSLPLRDSAIKVSRSGMIARAATGLLDKMTVNLAAAVGLEKVSMLKSPGGASVDKAVSSMIKDGLDNSGRGRIGRRDVLAILRCRRGVGVVGSDGKAGLLQPTVMSAQAFEETKAAAAASQQPVISSNCMPGVYGSDEERDQALRAFASAHDCPGEGLVGAVSDQP